MAIEEKPKETPKPVTVHTGSMVGVVWSIGWMFTIAFAKLIWWKALLALVIWPYYLGLAVR
ncbi:MAG: hypothetical protein FD146_1451 [Anaerolineaceae bacterium]|nr:MAG: hypothetical protein FD146_1451 [Anaerolineaceae bacterium]